MFQLRPPTELVEACIGPQKVLNNGNVRDTVTVCQSGQCGNTITLTVALRNTVASHGQQGS